MADNKFQTPEALARCLPMSRLQAVLSGKWKILILWYVAFYRVQRFGALLRRLDGITQSTLTRQLRELEADGFLHRSLSRGSARVEYTLTAMGELSACAEPHAAVERNASLPAGHVNPYQDGGAAHSPERGIETQAGTMRFRAPPVSKSGAATFSRKSMAEGTRFPAKYSPLPP
ncbi:MAG: winged helix-turn-helix transcriptional regulator [Flavonifractor plautii]